MIKKRQHRLWKWKSSKLIKRAKKLGLRKNCTKLVRNCSLREGRKKLKKLRNRRLKSSKRNLSYQRQC